MDTREAVDPKAVWQSGVRMLRELHRGGYDAGAYPSRRQEARADTLLLLQFFCEAYEEVVAAGAQPAAQRPYPRGAQKARHELDRAHEASRRAITFQPGHNSRKLYVPIEIRWDHKSLVGCDRDEVRAHVIAAAAGQGLHFGYEADVTDETTIVFRP